MKMKKQSVKEKEIQKFLNSIPDKVLTVAHFAGKDEKSNLVAEKYGMNGLNVYLEAIYYDYSHPGLSFKVARALEREFGI